MCVQITCRMSAENGKIVGRLWAIYRQFIGRMYTFLPTRNIGHVREVHVPPRANSMQFECKFAIRLQYHGGMCWPIRIISENIL